MRRLAVMLLAVAVGLAAAAPGAKDPRPKGPPSLVGEWVVEKRVTSGTAEPVPAGARITFTAEGTTDYRALPQAGATYKVDAGQTPAEVNVHPPALSSVPPEVGIFKVEGDTLTLCLTHGGQRPTRFESANGSRTTLTVARRVKPKE